METTFKGFTIRAPQLAVIVEQLKTIIQKEDLIMATLEEIKANSELAVQKIDALNVALDGYRALVASIQAELEALKTTTHLNPVVQSKVDEIGALISTAIAKVDETYAENFPGGGGPGEPPPDEV